MATDLVLLCHGATRATRVAAFPHDEPLEAAAMERFVPGLDLRATGRIWTSPALCARQTAAAAGWSAEPETALRECDYGRWSGRTLTDIAADEPDGMAAWLRDTDAAPHGGDSIGACLQRVAAWLDGLRETSGRHLAVTHASVLRAAVVHVLQAPATAFWQVDAAPLGTIRLRSDGRRWALRAGGSERVDA